MAIYIDEAWRWPLAGPVWVGAVTPLMDFDTAPFRDSKQLTEKQREACYDQILILAKEGKIVCASSYSRATTIDNLWIIRAQRRAMKKCISVLEGENSFQTHVVIDWNHTFWLHKKREVETIIKWDQKVPYISMASIIAKVERDRFMVRQAKRHAAYWFEQHKGYGTKFHREQLIALWLCPIHRKSFCGNFVLK
jgi:ribonuclease HII